MELVRPGDVLNVSLQPIGGGPLALGGGGAPRADGHFDIAGIVAGQYSLRAWPGGGQTLAAQDLTVTGNVNGVIVTLAPPFDLPGQVTIAEAGSKVKLAGLSVSVYSVAVPFNSQNASVDASGKFSLKNLSGRYRVFSDVPDGCFVQSVKLGGQEISPDEFAVQSAAPLEVVLSTTAAEITGSVIDKDGQPVLYSPTVALVRTEKDAKAVRPFNTDGDTFTFIHVKPGTYRLFVWEDVEEGAWEDPDFRKKYEDRAVEVTVGPNETKKLQITAIPADAAK